MSSFIAPPLRQLVCALHSAPEHLEESLRQANDWIRASLNSLHLLGPVVLWSQDTEEVLRQTELDLKECLRLLKDQSRASADLVARLTETIMSYYTHLLQLQALEARLPVLSPVLSLDQLSKVASNVLQGKVDVFELRTRFPLVRADVVQMRQQLDVRKSLYQEISWPQELEEHMRTLEGGLGAVAHYLETGDVNALGESIPLMSQGSSELAKKLAELTEAQRYSTYDVVEFWARLVDYPYDLGEEVMQQSWERLFQEVESYKHALELSARAGLSVANPELMKEALDLVGQTRLQLTELGQVNGAEVAEKLNPLWQAMSQCQGRIQDTLKEWQTRLVDSPRFLELLEMLGQVGAGVLPGWVLAYEIKQRQQQQQQALKALQESALNSPAHHGCGDLEILLATHEQAFQYMLRYMDDPQIAYLVEGWKLLAQNLGPLLEFEAQIRRQRAKTGKSGQSVTCVRCGHIQAPARVCSQCNAVLAQVPLDEIRYEEVGSGPAASEIHQLAEHLQEMVQGLAFGITTWQQVIDEIVVQLQTLEKTRLRFERELVSIMGRYEHLDSYCQFFAVYLGKLSQALAHLGEAAQAHNQTTLQAGLISYRQLHEELIEFQNKIVEGMSTLAS